MNRTYRRTRVTRRVFLGAAASTSTVVGAGLLRPASVHARDDEDKGQRANPNPIPEGVAPFAPFAIRIRHLPPTPGTPLANISEPSQITDFDGFVGLTRIRGGGTGFDTQTGRTQALAFQADMGFNQGKFVGTDGRRHEGTFAFV
ncbi:MAG TPA: hypothetical protein VGY48_34895 [Vicinamibacterales bacterium]|jgi:hypothetical protein|nr:hypothetical protein [Vicinamibacterales bacterium]